MLRTVGYAKIMILASVAGLLSFVPPAVAEPIWLQCGVEFSFAVDEEQNSVWMVIGQRYADNVRITADQITFSAVYSGVLRPGVWTYTINRGTGLLTHRWEVRDEGQLSRKCLRVGANHVI